MAGKNASKGGRLPGFFEDYGMGVNGGGLILDKPTKIPNSSKSTGGKSTPKKPSGGKKK